MQAKMHNNEGAEKLFISCPKSGNETGFLFSPVMFFVL
jgi:hypothetical protein